VSKPSYNRQITDNSHSHRSPPRSESIHGPGHVLSASDGWKQDREGLSEGEEKGEDRGGGVGRKEQGLSHANGNEDVNGFNISAGVGRGGGGGELVKGMSRIRKGNGNGNGKGKSFGFGLGLGLGGLRFGSKDKDKEESTKKSTTTKFLARLSLCTCVPPHII